MCSDLKAANKQTTNHKAVKGQSSDEKWSTWVQFLGCENDSFPLLSSDGVKLNICGEHWRHHTECCSSSVHLSLSPYLSICLPLSFSVRRRLSSIRLQTGSNVCCMVTLTEVSLFFLVLCIALRKCSTPHSAGSSSKGGVGWRRSHSSCTHILSHSLCLSLSLSLSILLPLLSAVKLHWTVIAQSIMQKRAQS